MLRKFIVFFSFIVLTYSHAESMKEDYPIDLLHQAGEYLIYHCERKHYACVNKRSFDDCAEERTKVLENQKEEKLPCYRLIKFDDKVSCVKANYKAVDSLELKRFCYRNKALKN